MPEALKNGNHIDLGRTQKGDKLGESASYFQTTGVKYIAPLEAFSKHTFDYMSDFLVNCLLLVLASMRTHGGISYVRCPSKLLL